MTPIDERNLEKLLRTAPTSGDLDRAVESLLDRAERDGLFDVAYANVDSHSAGFSSPGPIAVSSSSPCPATRGRSLRGRGPRRAPRRSLRGCSSPLRLDEERRELDDYFDGRRDRFEVPVDWRLTAPGFRAARSAPWRASPMAGPNLRRDRPLGGERAGLPRRRNRLRCEPRPALRAVPPRRSVRRWDRQLRRRAGDEASAAGARGRGLAISGNVPSAGLG